MVFKVSIDETIKKMVKVNLCAGCGTCVALCPFSAIEIIKDGSKGIYIPKLDDQKCNRCGICRRTCPGDYVDSKELNQCIFCREPEDTLFGNYLNCYVGYSIDYNIRHNSSSGGLVTAVLIYALEEGLIDGALVTKMRIDNPLEPEPFIARTRDEIIEASKSKYCPVPANIALSEILKQEGKYAVVGLPCHIHGIRKAEIVNRNLKERIVLHLGIFCSGVPNFRATEFLLRRSNLHVGKIKKLNYRGEGWPGNMSLYLKNGKVKFIPYPKYWDGFGNLFFPPRCIECIDWFSKFSDISFGDAWLPEIKKDDKIGTSAIISRTRQGDKILHKMLQKGAITLNPIGADKIFKSQPGFSRKMKRLMARHTISKFFGGKIQACNYDCLPQPLLVDYLNIVLLYSQSFLASKYKLWWVLDIFHLLLRYSSSLKSRLGL